MQKISVPQPFDFALNARLLRRFSPPLNDAFDGEVYLRALPGTAGPRILSIREESSGVIEAQILNEPAAVIEAITYAQRLFGTEVNLDEFNRAIATVPWLAPLVAKQHGLRPTRYPTLWEASVNAVIFQSVSIHAASAILARVLTHFTKPVQSGGHPLAPFPTPERILETATDDFRALGLSGAKVRALHTIAQNILEGRLDETVLEQLPTPEILASLCLLRGIGPWTATIIALRGFGRLDYFPLGDSGVARIIRNLSGAEPDIPTLLSILGAQQGMLYFHFSSDAIETFHASKPTELS